MSSPASRRSRQFLGAPWTWWAALLLVDVFKHAGLLAYGSLQPWPDSESYWKLGGDAASGDVWLVNSGLAFRTPLYPWFLGFFEAIASNRALWTIVLTQHVLEIAVSFLTAAAVYGITRSTLAALAAYGVCALTTARPLFANWLLTETGATFLTALVMWLLVQTLHSPRRRYYLWSAVVCGCGILLRPSAAAYVPALCFAAWKSLPAGTSFVKRAGRVAAAMTICAAVVLPWCWRNSLVWNRFTLTVFLGRELWTSHFSPWPGTYLDVPTTGRGAELRTLLKGETVNLHHNWGVASALSRQGLNDVEVDDLMKDVSLLAIWPEPGRVGLHFLARCLTFWYVKDWELTDFPSQEPWDKQLGWSDAARREQLERWLRFTPERHFRAVWLASAMTWFGILVLLLHPPQRDAGIVLGTMMLGLTVLTAALEIPCYRYRCVLEPVMIASAVSGLTCLGKRRSGDTVTVANS